MSLRHTCAALALLAAAAPLARAQSAAQEFNAIPRAVAPQYHFDFARNFFASPEAEKADMAKVYAVLKQLEAYKGKVTASADNLLRALQLNDEVQRLYVRHYIYLYLRYAVNTKDDADRQRQAKLGAEMDTRTGFMQQELMRLDDKTLARYMAEKPALKQYAFVIEQSRRLRPHTLSPGQEEVLNTTAPLMADWQGQLYQRAIDRTKFGTVHTPSGDLDVLKQERAIINSPDRAAREAGFLKRYEGYASQRDLYAFAMTRLVRSRDEISQLRHYPDNPHDVHFNLFLTTPEVKGVFEKVAQQGDFNKRYQQLRIDRVKQITGYDTVHLWDMSVIPPGMTRPRFDIQQASRVIEETLAPLGPEWAKELKALLNPANGRLDIVPGDNRVPGAFAWGFPGSQISIFYDYNFEGYFEDVSTLAHESGHAVHYQLMANNHVLPPYTNGPSYFTESFAMFNELLLADHLYKTEADHLRKTYYLEQFLGQAMSLFGITRQAALEQAMYDGVAAGKLNAPADFDRVTLDLGKRYSLWYDRQPELKNDWIVVHHYYDAPMYYVNYVFASLLSLKYYEMYSRDPKTFIPHYLALVRNGFNAPPTTLLKKFLGLDLKDPKLVSDAIGVLEPRIGELKALYAEKG